MNVFNRIILFLFRCLKIFLYWLDKEVLPYVYKGLGYGIGFILALGYFGFLASCSKAAEIQVPTAAYQHKADLIRSAHFYFGINAPVAVFAAQIHQESRWNAEAKSPVGAQGLAQFMPQTSAWLPEVAPETGKPNPYNPVWAIRALCAYDKWLYDRMKGINDYERMAFTLSAYNGGQGWVAKDKKEAIKQGHNSDVWFGHVELINAGRSKAAYNENRLYPKRILEELQHIYIKSGFGLGLIGGS